MVTEPGPQLAPGRRDSGFTLIELLVAVMIFAMLATAGVALLRSSVDGQATVRTHLDALADVQRGLATLDADLSQAVVRISRTDAGTLAPVFFGRAAQGDEPLMQFVRDGWANPGTLRRPSLQKVEYWWRDGRLERIGYAAVDGAPAPEPAVLFDDVTALTLRYRARNGAWLERWAPARPIDMPTAVEIALTRRNAAPLTLRFLVGTAMSQPPVDDAAAGGLADGQ
ncbi:type II secretion system minor pseudopilin GspJ [Sphingobium lignivorans]|uniref:Type II secretion system protein J n=1 Tax=Sphingobium lignivorans TaxID=2735886 RepID=A0ABR6NDU4_9SPHN|nr:general secretion pathway protein J [Sphingobium lignivorans]